MLVVDASVLVKLAAKEPDSELAIATILPREDCIAPDLLFVEVASALAKKIRFSDLSPDLARIGFDTVLPLIAEVVDSMLLLDRAMLLSAQLNHSLFDCVYLALAVERECVVLTADQKFAARAIAAGYGSNVDLLR